MSINRATLLVGATSVLFAVALLVGGAWPIWLRTLIGIPFVLLLPGQAAMLTVDPNGRLDVAESFTLAVGLSISLVILLGVAMASTVGLTAGGMIVAIATTTLVALIVANIRTDSWSREAPPPTRRNPGWRAVFGTLILLGCAVLILAVSIPYPGASRSGSTVQLWGLVNGSRDGVSIEANNVSAPSARYVLTVSQGDRMIARQEFIMNPGTAHIFIVRPAALWTTAAPVEAALTDVRGVVPARTISVWTTR